MQDTFTTIASFTYPSEAQIFKGKLESEGIEVFLKDEHTINTDPLISNAIGGVKLRVLRTQKNKAISILETISTYSIDDHGKPIICPNCNKDTVALYSTINDFKSLVFFIIGFFANILPFYTKYTYRCESCNTEFNL